jgi:hypothetical protein
MKCLGVACDVFRYSFLFLFIFCFSPKAEYVLSSSVAASQIPHLKAFPLYVHYVNAIENNSSWAIMSLNFLHFTEYRDDRVSPLGHFNPVHMLSP